MSGVPAFRVGLLGCGNVGSAVARLLHDHSADIERRCGVRIEVERVAVRDAARLRPVPVTSERFTTDPFAVAHDDDVDVVVEVLGGVEPARSLILAALKAGRPVVTANKELLSTHGVELFDAAVGARVDLLYEAAVGGAMPVIRTIREHLAGDRIVRLAGILNGTTNYVLTRMTEDGWTLAEALGEAQRLGLAEADPSADVDGRDAAAKAAILATIAFDLPVTVDDVHREGIAAVSAEDIANARRMGYVVKLLAIADAVGDAVSVRTHPAMLPADHPLASVRESFNAVLMEGERAGPIMVYGRGAGGDPTATSVVGDLIELARSRGAPGSITAMGHAAHRIGAGRRLRPLEDLQAHYYLLMRVADRPGVLAAIAGAFAENAVSIKQVWQEGRGEDAQIALITHRAAERDLQTCVRTLRGLDPVDEVASVIRVEAGDP